jgi:hypothetical protein
MLGVSDEVAKPSCHFMPRETTATGLLAPKNSWLVTSDGGTICQPQL